MIWTLLMQLQDILYRICDHVCLQNIPTNTTLCELVQNAIEYWEHQSKSQFVGDPKFKLPIEMVLEIQCIISIHISSTCLKFSFRYSHIAITWRCLMFASMWRLFTKQALESGSDLLQYYIIYKSAIKNPMLYSLVPSYCI